MPPSADENGHNGAGKANADRTGGRPRALRGPDRTRKCKFRAIHSGYRAPHNASQAEDAPPRPRSSSKPERAPLDRLVLRLDSLTGRAFHTPGYAELLKGDTADKRWSDTDVVHRWAA